ncbi:unnamed protein product [Nyctereutes procyonoides]|uniref:Natural killer cells antigen CD94 n=1 Tax=Nyctereutes procyonoides TaxID=34880 RepID=A0A811YY68_NYCPR|nr:natural killer cells antigen CD94 [Nyctereutes procyonoides]CAD7681400.1 unnamed protein product [Nyctereutes procyonoides]
MAVSQTTLWNLISGILGVMCLLLMTTMGILLKNLLLTESIQPTLSPGPITELQKGSDCCSCPKRWIGHQCNCYLFFDELKSWTESRDFCASQNSSLLHIQNRDELRFVSSSKYFYWIGVYYSKENGTWLWENGLAISQDLLQTIQTFDTKKCVIYSSSHSVLDVSCEDKSRFICKQELM